MRGRVVAILLGSWVLATGSAPVVAEADSVRSLVVEAERACRRGDFGDAERHLARARESAPAAFAVHDARVWCLLEARRLDDAASEAEAGCRDHPASAERWTVLGEVRYRRAEFAEARGAFERAVGHGGTGRALAGLARLEAAIGRRASANRLVRAGLEVDPHDPDLLLLSFPGLERYEDRLRVLEAWVGASDERRAPEAAESVAAYLEFLRLAGARPLDVPRLPEGPVRVPLTRAPFEPVWRDGRLVGTKTRYDPLPRVEVTLNGVESCFLTLDTGASGILVDKRVARRAGVRILNPISLRGLGNRGAGGGNAALAERVAIGDWIVENVALRVAEDPDRLPPGSAGLIGTDVFAAREIHVSYAQETLELRPFAGERQPFASSFPWSDVDAAALPEDPARVRCIGPDLLVEGDVAGLGRRLFLIDTGAGTSIVDSRLATEVTRVYDSGFAATGISGRVKEIRDAQAVDIAFGSFEAHLRAVPVTDLGALSRALGVEVAGVIGDPVLSRHTLVLDYRACTVRFVPAPVDEPAPAEATPEEAEPAFGPLDPERLRRIFPGTAEGGGS